MFENCQVQVMFYEKLLIIRIHSAFKHIFNVKWWRNCNQSSHFLCMFRHYISHNIISTQRCPNKIHRIVRIINFYSLQCSLYFMEFKTDKRNRTSHFRIDTPTIKTHTTIIILTSFLNQCLDIFTITTTSHTMHDHNNRFSLISFFF